jgi:polysaccharide export outer membrane protein
MKMRRYFVLVTILLASACPVAVFAQSVSSSNPAAESHVVAGDSNVHPLQIAAGDLLDVVVFDTPQLSGKVRVDGHGDIRLPLAGDLFVSQLTAEQAGRAIEAKLLHAQILKDPHVLVSVLEYSTQGVTVLGEVKQTGVYPLLGPHVLLDLISAAGGFTADAGELVTITHRAEPDNPVVLKIGTKPGSTGGANIDIRPGDTIVVSHAGVVYVLGDVGKPGGFLIQRNGDLTVLRAMALAQGANRTAALNSAKLIHQSDGAREELALPLRKILSNKAPDRILADGDILFIPSSAAKNALVTAESILPSTASAAVFRVP